MLKDELNVEVGGTDNRYLNADNQNGVSVRTGSGVSREDVPSMLRGRRRSTCGRWGTHPCLLLPLFPCSLPILSSLTHGTCSLVLPGPGYSQAPPNSDKPSELPGLHGQTAWVPPVLAVQLGCWGRRPQPDMLPKEE